MAFAKTTWVQNALPADTATQKNRIESAIDDLYNSGIRKAAGAFRAWNAAGAGTTVPASVANPGTKIACDSEQNDVSGWYDPAQSRFTPQLAGIYWLVHRVNTTQVLASGTNVEGERQPIAGIERDIRRLRRGHRALFLQRHHRLR
jgi:hypothetical protein